MMKPVPALLSGARQRSAAVSSDLPFRDPRMVTLVSPRTVLGSTEHLSFPVNSGGEELRTR